MRHAMIIVMTAIVIGCAVGCSSVLGWPPADYSPVQQEQPPALRMLYATSEAGSDAISSAIETYTQRTGIQIETVTLPYNSLQEKVFSELAQGSGYYDLVALDTPWMPKMLQHLEPLGTYISQTKRPDLIQLADFIPKVFFDTSVYKKDAPEQQPPSLESVQLDAILSTGYDIWSLPIQSNVLTVSYRKDLFENPQYRDEFQMKYGRELTIPETMEQYLEIARFFTRDTDGDGKIDLYGTTLTGRKHEALFVDYKSFLSVYGGQLFDETLRPTFHNEQGIRALEAYGSWIQTYKVTPPNVLTYAWDEVSIMFGFGQVAMGMNYHNMKLEPGIKNGRVGYFLFPGEQAEDGSLIRGPHFGSWGIAVNRYSADKQAAYELAEYLTSPEAQTTYLPYSHHVTRQSAYDQSRSLPDASLREYYNVLGDSLRVGVGRPRITNYYQVSEAVQSAVSSYLTGRQSAQDALTEGAERVELLMKQAGY